MRTIWQDLRYSARLLRKHPGFTVTAVAVLTLGIGVNAGIFGIINGLMIRPLAGADAPGEVVGVFSRDRTAARDYRPFSYPGFTDLRDADGPLASLAGHTVAVAGVTENNSTRPATVDIVTTGYFETLGVRPAASGCVAWTMSNMAGRFLFDLDPRDSRAYGVAIATLLAAAVIATVLPARRAATVEQLKRFEVNRST